MINTSSPDPRPSTPVRGILLIALGAAEYADMAANLAASIRYNDPDIPIHLVHTEKSVSHLSHLHRALFTSFALCPAEYYTRQEAVDPSSLEYIKAKTHIYELTPFDETLFLDADMYILPATRMSAVMEQLSSVCHYTIENRGYADLSQPIESLNPHYCNWVNICDVKTHYNTEGRFYHLHSEFIFFKKNEKNKKFFETVREVYDTRPLQWQVFDGGVPDEYAFDIATAVMAHYPHQDPYIAIYWHGMDGRKDWNKVVIKNYIGFSLGGNFIPQWLTQKINAYKQLFKQKLKLPNLFNVAPKRRWNAKRRGM